MHVTLIDCALIDVPMIPEDVRTFDKAFATQLAESIRVNRALVPIMVRPNPANQERFILVAGKHRLYATKKVLKEPQIAAHVFEDMDDHEAEIARDIENLWRNPLNPAQQAAALKRWYDDWQRKCAAAAWTAGESGTAAIANSAQPEPANTIEPGSRKPEAHKQAAFDQRVGDAMGKSVGAVTRLKRIAKAFAPEQLRVFADRETTQADMFWVAKIKDKAKRGAVVDLVADGRSVADAIAEIMGDAAPPRLNAPSNRKMRSEPDPTPRPDDSNLTDDQWFARHCGTKAAMLADPSNFKSDALLFRAVNEARLAFRSAVAGALATTEASGGRSAFLALVSRLASVSHPGDWPVCGVCQGTGTAPNESGAEGSKQAVAKTGGQCPECGGGGYRVGMDGAA